MATNATRGHLVSSSVRLLATGASLSPTTPSLSTPQNHGGYNLPGASSDIRLCPHVLAVYEFAPPKQLLPLQSPLALRCGGGSAPGFTDGHGRVVMGAAEELQRKPAGELVPQRLRDRRARESRGPRPVVPGLFRRPMRREPRYASVHRLGQGPAGRRSYPRRRRRDAARSGPTVCRSAGRRATSGRPWSRTQPCIAWRCARTRGFATRPPRRSARTAT